MDFEAWRCKHEKEGENLFCPDEGCSKADGCARDRGVWPPQPTPAPVTDEFKELRELLPKAAAASPEWLELKEIASSVGLYSQATAIWAYIAVANPAVIAKLIADRDVLAARLAVTIEVLKEIPEAYWKETKTRLCLDNVPYRAEALLASERQRDALAARVKALENAATTLRVAERKEAELRVRNSFSQKAGDEIMDAKEVLDKLLGLDWEARAAAKPEV